MTGRDFWSRRRAAVAAEAETEARTEAAAEAEAHEAALADRTDADILQDLGLPDPDTLGEGDDFRAFLAKAVPERLRRRALRRLWLTNPTLANLDGLIEYGEDYTDAATVVENLATTYQVGKGMKAHIEALLAQDEDAAENPAEAPDDAPDDVPDQTADPEDDAPEDAPPAPTAMADAPEPGAAPAAEAGQIPEKEKYSYAKPGRMRYRFDSGQGDQA